MTKFYSDVDQLREDARGWSVEYDQFGPGPFEGTLQLFQNDSVQFSRSQWNRSVYFRGDVPKGSVAFGFPLSFQPSMARFEGTEVSDDHMLTQRAGSEVDYVSPETRDGFVVSTCEDVARQTLSIIVDDGEELLDQLGGARRVGTSDAYRVRYLGQAVSGSLQALDESEESSVAADRLCVSLLETCLVVFAMGASQDKGHTSARKASRIVSDAEDFAQDCGWDYVTVLDVCRAVDVSERTLHYAFNSALGISPARWLRLKRLNAARRKLAEGSPTDMRVREVALEFGFTHFGNFSLTYKRQFGEMPSETLAR